MTRVIVCSLSRIDEIAAASGARSMVTLINAGTPVQRPAGIAPERHLFIGMSDIAEPLDGHIAPGGNHVDQLLDFARAWDRRAPLLIHCWAGVSRSTAAAFVSACALNPEREEAEIAAAIRAASPTATPNPRFVAIADERLKRSGRMIAAVEAIGRGEDCFEGVPFDLPLS
ncbi:MAG: tyrosine phosphatase family protein [Rhodoblastus sp.]